MKTTRLIMVGLTILALASSTLGQQSVVIRDPTTAGRYAIVTSGGSLTTTGGTQYAHGDSATTPTGTVGFGLATTGVISMTNNKVYGLNFTLKGGLRGTMFDSAGIELTGPAGTASAAVLSVQGIASMTPIQVQSNSANIATETTAAKLTIAQNADLGSNTGALTFGSVTTAAPNYTTAKVQPFSLNIKGGLRTTLMTEAGAETGTATSPLYVQNSTAGFVARGADGAGNLLTSTSNALDVNLKSGLTVDVAEGSAAGTTPVLVGGQVAATEMAAATAANVVKSRFNTTGGILTASESFPADQWQASSAGTAVTSAALKSIRTHTDNYYTTITSLDVINTHATAGGIFQIVQGTGTLCATDQVILYEMGAAAAYGGIAKGNGKDVIITTTVVSSDLCIKVITADASMNWSARGYLTKILRAN